MKATIRAAGRLALAATLLLLSWTGPLFALNNGAPVAYLYCYSGTAPASPLSWSPCSSLNPLNITGSLSTTIAGFHPVSSLTPITATTGGVTSSAFTAGQSILVQNVGATNAAYCAPGASATTSSQYIAPGSSAVITTTTETTITCATSTSTTTVNFQVGTGLWTGAGGGGGGSGSSGAVYGPTAVGSANANPPVVIGGTATGAAGQNVEGVAVKPASTASVATDLSLVTNESPNSQLSVATGTTVDSPATVPTTSAAASTIALLKALNNSVVSSVPAGTNSIGTTQLPTNVTATDCSGTVTTGGTAVNAFTAQTTLHGFTIVNTNTAEVMWISFTTTAAASTAGSYPIPAATATTFAGGGSFTSPPGFGLNHALSVVAATSAHSFSCTWW